MDVINLCYQKQHTTLDASVPRELAPGRLPASAGSNKVTPLQLRTYLLKHLCQATQCPGRRLVLSPKKS